VTLFAFLSVKNDINVPSESSKHKNNFCWHPEGHCGKEQDPEPDLNTDPLVRGTDSRIRIRTKISRIWNTASSPTIIYKKKFSTLQKIKLNILVSDGGRRAGMAEGCRGSEFRLHVQAAYHRYVRIVRLKKSSLFVHRKFQKSGTSSEGLRCLSLHAYKR
jgi:hypothetical protein